MDTEYLLIPWHTHLQTAELELNQVILQYDFKKGYWRRSDP